MAERGEALIARGILHPPLSGPDIGVGMTKAGIPHHLAEAVASQRRLFRRRPALLAALMMTPFLILAVATMVAPVVMLAVQSVEGPDGLTLDYIVAATGPTYRLAAWNSVVLSFASATVALCLGLGLALIAGRPNANRTLAALLNSFSVVAANFAGVPLAFAFVSTLGLFGLVTRMLRAIGIDIYAMGFSLYSMAGLTIAYAYFLTPLMVIIIAPAVRALRDDWMFAARSLGASPLQRFWLVTLPILAPSLLSAFILLFGSAFSGYATAYALTSGNIVLMTTEIGNVLSGDVTSAPQLGAVLSVAMILIMGLLLLLSTWLVRSTSRRRS